MVEAFGAQTWAFSAAVGAVLGTVADAFWHLLMAADTCGVRIGVLGSVWQVSVGIPQGWISAAINAGGFFYATTPAVRRVDARQ